MLFKSPRHLHYPIKVTKLRNENDKVKRFEMLFSYSFKASDELDQRRRAETVEAVEERNPTLLTDFQAENEGTLKKWFISEGDVIERPGVLLFELTEICSHQLQWGRMCAYCGEDMDRVSFNTTNPDTSRAPVVGAHGSSALRISEDLARKADAHDKDRLLESRKLSLVVDLDQTIIHATVDPTVAEWQKDLDNPNYDAVKDVRSFQLLDNGPSDRGCWYYIKLRPGLRRFLKSISEVYELHIYTMGTRAYARNVVEIIDPDHKIFGDRILSRDESGSLTAKTLHRIFPVDNKMVVIIDDRGDVWNWHRNLIKVTPYDFFVGIGDINSSFLPKRHGVAAANGTAAESRGGPQAQEARALPTIQLPSKPGGEASLEEQLVAMSGGDNPELLKEQTDEQNVTIETQMQDKPLLRRQEIINKAEQKAVAHKEESCENNDEMEVDAHKPHSLLHDDDNELIHLEANLRSVHTSFYARYDENVSKAPGNKLAHLRGDRGLQKRPLDNAGLIPEVENILFEQRKPVLQGVRIVFTGLVPLDADIHTSEYAKWAGYFGAKVSERINKKTTHVVAARNRRTHKVRQAARHDRIHIVTLDWLRECLVKWERVLEAPCLIHVEPDERGPHAPQDSAFDELGEGTVLSSSDEDSTTSNMELDEAADDDDMTDGSGGGDENDEVDAEDDANYLPTGPVNESNLRLDDSQREDLEKELAEFLGESDTDGEGSERSDGFDSDASVHSGASIKSTRIKRKREAAWNDNSDASDSESNAPDCGTVSNAGSRLQRRKKRALARVTSLTNVANADQLSGLPSPDTTGPEEAQCDDGDSRMHDTGADGNDAADDDDAALEAELLAEFEKDDDDNTEDASFLANLAVRPAPLRPP